LAALRAAGTEVSSLGLVGGGARSDFWAQLHASVLGVEVKALEGAEAGGALGAARLAWLADGGTESQVCKPPKTKSVFEPDQALQPELAERYERFRRLYGALQPIFKLSAAQKYRHEG
jgi:xylulokinase